MFLLFILPWIFEGSLCLLPSLSLFIKNPSHGKTHKINELFAALFAQIVVGIVELRSIGKMQGTIPRAFKMPNFSTLIICCANADRLNFSLCPVSSIIFFFLFRSRCWPMLGKFTGLLFALLIFISSLLGSIFLLFPYIPLAKFFPKQWRFVADRFVGLWLTFPAVSFTIASPLHFQQFQALIEKLFGCRFKVTGDLIQRDKAALIIMNHRTR